MNRSVPIILLNGVGSSGKRSIAKQLQKIAGKPLIFLKTRPIGERALRGMRRAQ